MAGEKAKFAEDVMTAANRAKQPVSVGIEDVEPNDRVEMVYKPDSIRSRGTTVSDGRGTTEPDRSGPASKCSALLRVTPLACGFCQ
jgi:hypothetical protein